MCGWDVCSNGPTDSDRHSHASLSDFDFSGESPVCNKVRSVGSSCLPALYQGVSRVEETSRDNRPLCEAPRNYCIWSEFCLFAANRSLDRPVLSQGLVDRRCHVSCESSVISSVTPASPVLRAPFGVLADAVVSH